MEVWAILNQKGGVAKTTTTLALGAGLRRRGKSVLFIDADPQRDLSRVLGADTTGLTTLEVLLRRATAEQAIQRTEQGDVIAASAGLAADGILTTTGREYRLREALEALNRAYDYILIDCPPSLGVLTVNALTAATGCILPCQADILSLEALDMFQQTYEAMKRYTNPGLTIKGIVITRYSGRSILGRDMVDNIEEKSAALGTKVYNTKIRECIALKEAQAVREDIFSYAPKSNAALDYDSLLTEILEG